MKLAEARRAINAAISAPEVRNQAGTATVKTISYGPMGDVIKGNVAGVTLREYGGVPAWSWEVRERGAHGRRTHYVWWLADAVHQVSKWKAGDLVAYSVCGNYQGSTFRELNDSHVAKIEGLALS